MTKALSLNTSKILTLALLGILFAFAYFVFVPHTFAQDASPSADKTARKEARMLKVCQTHERNIKTRLDSLIRLVTNQETKFDAIATRVETRYTTKLVPKGKTLSNFDALVADIAAKKAAVDTTLATAKSDVASFSCTAPDPKSQLTTFRKDMQAVKAALKEYRKSVRNLVVTVRTLAGESLESPKALPEANK